MFKKMSLSAENDAEQSAAQNSESRMLRALEALSNQPQPSPDPSPPAVRDHAAFRTPPTPPREPFRNDASFHGTKGRHRFVRDGEVPVVHMSVPRSRDAAPPPPGRSDADWARLQQTAEEYRLRAEQAERKFAEGSNHIKTLQTKLAHTELALGDALALAQNRLIDLHAFQERTLKPPPPIAVAPPDPVIPPSPQPSSTEAPVKRGPGRPRRIVPFAPPLSDAPIKRGPGRPRRVVTEIAAAPIAAPAPAAVIAPPPASAPVKRGPGRPRRIEAAPAPVAPPAKRGPGRPRRDGARPTPPPVDPEPVEWWLLPAKPGKRRG